MEKKKKSNLRFSERFNTIICLKKKNSVNVQKIANDANILIAAMPFIFLLRWDEKVWRYFFGNRTRKWWQEAGVEGKIRRLNFFIIFVLLWLNAWTLCAFDHHYLIMLHVNICSPFGLCHSVQRASFIFSLIEHLICWSSFKAVWSLLPAGRIILLSVTTMGEGQTLFDRV